MPAGVIIMFACAFGDASLKAWGQNCKVAAGRCNRFLTGCKNADPTDDHLHADVISLKTAYLVILHLSISHFKFTS